MAGGVPLVRLTTVSANSNTEDPANFKVDCPNLIQTKSFNFDVLAKCVNQTFLYSDIVNEKTGG